MKAFKFILFSIILLLSSNITVEQTIKSDIKIEESIKTLNTLFYCGNTDSYPHWRLKDIKFCSDFWKVIHDRGIWMDAISSRIIIEFA